MCGIEAAVDDNEAGAKAPFEKSRAVVVHGFTIRVAGADGAGGPVNIDAFVVSRRHVGIMTAIGIECHDF